MSNEKKVKIAIISDLHCHPNSRVGNHSTYLITDTLRSTNDHPVESLIKIINDNEITVDLTLCPGDFTDRADIQGLISGWNFSLEINKELRSENIIATVGNHDVDVYGTTSNYSLNNVKGIKRGFPINDENLRDKFWSKGCVFVEGKDYRVLVINSSHFHYNMESSHNGEISHDAIEYIQNYLSANVDDKIQIAMSHHPPIAHPRKKLGEDDKIVNGEVLLDVLGKHGFDLFIYGHKHDPFLRYHPIAEGSQKIPLFSAGSFSACSNIIFTGLRNSFHTIELSKKNNDCKGVISTWTYLPDIGWKKNFDESAFAPITGFGNKKSVSDIFNELKELIGSGKKITWEEVSLQIEDINYLIPSDALELYELLKNNNYITDEHLLNSPTTIYNLNDLA